jgi:hypothetical protein
MVKVKDGKAVTALALAPARARDQLALLVFKRAFGS